MNTQPAQPIPGNVPATQPLPRGRADQHRTARPHRRAARHPRRVPCAAPTASPTGLADYLHATGRDQPQPPDWAGYNANLLIDQVSFTAHSLRAHRRKPLQ
ncbi:hypothetical protein [Mycobacterium riyadhense]|uniref:hypothetical protein n=1 Tax=Mycobacterium riyadhense TaxID=486698 RepID=UPI0019518847|nr:hypothetical protein [Mycobacterium riyadhense]